MALDEERDRHGGGGREGGGSGAVGGGVQGRVEDRDGRQRRRGALVEPVGERVERQADREPDQRGETCEHRDRPPAEPHARGRAHRVPSARAATATPERLPGEERQPERDEDERQGRTGRRGEADLELGVDLGGEGLEAEDLEGAELGEQDQGDEERPADERGPDLVERDADERAGPPEAEAAGDVLETRVGGPKGRGHGQVDERVAPEAHHEHRAPVPVHGGLERDPAVPEDEVGHRERQHEDDPPESPPRKLGALDAPGDGHPDHRAHDRHGCGQPHGVPEQRYRQMPEEQRVEGRPADLRPLQQEERERQGGRSRRRRGRRRRARPAATAAPLPGSTGGWRRAAGRSRARRCRAASP